MEAKVNIATEVSELHQDEINSNIIRQKRLNALGPIKLYQEIHLKDFYVLVRAPTEVPTIPNVLIPVTQKSITEFNFMYDINLLNVMPENGKCHLDSYPMFMVNVKDSLLNEIVDLNIPSSKQSMFKISMLMTALNFITKHFSGLMSSVPIIVNTRNSIDFKTVDVTKIPERNFVNLFGRIKNINERNDALHRLESFYQYVESKVIPEYARIITTQPYQEDDHRNYAQVMLPLHAYEADMIPIGHQLFNAQYCHPAQLVQYYQDFETENFVISNAFRTEVLQTGNGTRVPKVLNQVIDPEMIYRIPRVMRDFIVQIKSMVAVSVKIESLNDSVISLKNIFKLNAQADSPWSRFTECITSEGIVNAIKAMHYCNINRNLFLINTETISLSTMTNAFKMMSIFIAMTFLPPDVLPLNVRYTLNNSLAYYIYSYVMTAPEKQQFSIRLNARGLGELADNTSKWVNVKHDILVIIYQSLNMHSTLYNGIYDFFNGFTPDALNLMIDITPLSLIAPYLYSATYGRYTAVTAVNELRRRAQMPEGGCIRLSRNLGDPTNILQSFDMKMRAYTVFNTGARGGSHTAFTSDQNKMQDFITYIRDKGRMRFSMLVQYYEYFQIYYSSSICADAVYRNTPHLYREPLNMSLTDCLGIVLKLTPDVTLQDTPRMYFLSGTEGLIGLTVFLTFYRIITSMVAQFHGSEKIDKSHRIALANELSAKVLGLSNYDAEEEFQIQAVDKAAFSEFLDTAVKPEHRSWITDEINSLMGNATEMMHRLQNKFAIIKHIYVAKKSLHYNNGTDLNGPILASNAMPRSRIVVKKDYGSIREIRTDMNTNLIGGPRYGQYRNKFFEEFEKLREPSIDDLRNGTGTVEAIRIPVRSRVKLELLKEDGQFNEMRPTTKRFSDLEQFIRVGAESAEGMKLYELPIYLVLNDIGNQDTIQFMNISGSTYTDTLCLGQVFTTIEELSIDFLRPNQLLDSFNTEAIIRKVPFDIRNQMHVPFEVMDLNNPVD